MAIIIDDSNRRYGERMSENWRGIGQGLGQMLGGYLGRKSESAKRGEEAFLADALLKSWEYAEAKWGPELGRRAAVRLGLPMRTAPKPSEVSNIGEPDHGSYDVARIGAMMGGAVTPQPTEETRFGGAATTREPSLKRKPTKSFVYPKTTPEQIAAQREEQALGAISPEVRIMAWQVKNGIRPDADTTAKVTGSMQRARANIAESIYRNMDVPLPLATQIAENLVNGSMDADITGNVERRTTLPAIVAEYQWALRNEQLPKGVVTFANYVNWRDQITERHSPRMARFILGDPESGATLDEQWVDIKNAAAVKELVKRGYRSVTTEDLLFGAGIPQKMKRMFPERRETKPVKSAPNINDPMNWRREREEEEE